MFTRHTRFLLLSALCLALIALLSTPGQAQRHGHPFVNLLKGIYEPVVHGPNLGLSLVDLSDGTYMKTKIYRAQAVGNKTYPAQAVGNFYINFGADPPFTLCAYQFAGGAFTGVFTRLTYDVEVIDGNVYLVGTAQLVIPEATRTFRSYVGGSITMVFMTHVIDSVTFDEHCVCYVSPPRRR